MIWTIGFGKKKGLPGAIAFLKDLEQFPGKTLGFFLIFAVCLAGEFTARADGRDIDKMLRYLPVDIDVRENSLAAPRHRLLGELEDKHLRKLFYIVIATFPRYRAQKRY